MAPVRPRAGATYRTTRYPGTPSTHNYYYILPNNQYCCLLPITKYYYYFYIQPTLLSLLPLILPTKYVLFRRAAYYSQGAKRTTRWAPPSHPFQRRRSASNVLAKFCAIANPRLPIMFLQAPPPVVEKFLPSSTFAAASESDAW